MNQENRGTPSLVEFSPLHIPFQKRVIGDIDFTYDYSLGTHEILLSGSIGCLREDALIETASGLVPISDITKSHYLRSYDDQSNQFCFSQGSGAFPKGKDYLYRVVTTRGEFVASGHHHIATSLGDYLSVQEIYQRGGSESFLFHEQKYPSFSQQLSPVDVLDCWKTIASFLYHCVERIRLRDPQLLPLLNNALNSFPLRDDALRFGLFYDEHKHDLTDVQSALELTPSHIAELLSHASKQGCISQSEHTVFVWVDVVLGLELSSRSLRDTLLMLLSLFDREPHPLVLLYAVSKLSTVLSNILKPYSCSITDGTILKVEKQLKEEWYWDMQVPNTNNYSSSGMTHHNSAKSLLAAHCVVKHCLRYPRARVAICRRALPDLKKTLFQMILEHLECEQLVEGRDYFVQTSTANIQFSNKSEIVPLFWADKKFMRIRSLNLSAAVIEELTENVGDDWKAFMEVKGRIGRLPIPEKWLMCCTNPDGPSHPAYKYFIETKGHQTRHVYYSKTEDNPFLDKSYIRQLKEDMDPKTARRMLYGEWIEIDRERVYHAYKEGNRINKRYNINPNYPIILSFDFNIGQGKPMSSCAMQYIGDTFHVFDQVVVEGARTSDTMEEWYARGWFGPKHLILIHGDASGDARSTKSVLSDYGIIEKYLAAIPGCRFKMEVPRANPPVRTRHNRVNAYCLNEAGQVRLFVYDGASTVDEALRLTSLRKGGNYVEDDSQSFQHIGTALGYAVVYESNRPKGNFEYQTRIR